MLTCTRTRFHDIRTEERISSVLKRLTKEGELIPLYSLPLKVEAETMIPDDNFVFLAWPVCVVHKIDEESPLWDMSLEQLLQEKFEIVAVLEGTVEHTGMTAQLRSSYLPSEILWGHHLAPLVTYQKENGNYKIDYAQFHVTIPVDRMPECSARQLTEKKKLKREEANENNNAPTTATPHFREPEYPVNFTAPAFRPPKRTWSFRARGSLKGSIKRKGSSNKLKNLAGGATLPNGTIPKNPSPRLPRSPHSRCNSLQSVAEQEPLSVSRNFANHSTEQL